MGVPKGLLALDDCALVQGCPLSGRKIVQVDQISFQPLAIRTGGGQPGLDFVIANDPTFVGVDQEHPARLQASLLDHLACWHVDHADLAGHDHQVLGGHPVAARAQAVAVKDGSDNRAIGEGDRRRTVPRLHQGGVVLVEGSSVVGHLGVVLPRFRDHH